MNTPIMNTVRILPKGQIIIPQYMRDELKLSVGDTVSLTCENGKLTIENPLIAAMRKWQEAMKGKWEEAGLNTEEDIMDLVREVRYEIEGIT